MPALCEAHATPLSSASWWFQLSVLLCAATHVVLYPLLRPASHVVPAGCMLVLFGCQSAACAVALVLVTAGRVRRLRRQSPMLPYSPSSAMISKGLLQENTPDHIAASPSFPASGPPDAVPLQQLHGGFWWMLLLTVCVVLADLLWALCAVPSAWFLVVILPSPHRLRCGTTAVAVGIAAVCGIAQGARGGPRVDGPPWHAAALHAAAVLQPTVLMLLQLICLKYETALESAQPPEVASPKHFLPTAESTDRVNAGDTPPEDRAVPEPPPEMPGMPSDLALSARQATLFPFSLSHALMSCATTDFSPPEEELEPGVRRSVGLAPRAATEVVVGSPVREAAVQPALEPRSKTEVVERVGSLGAGGTAPAPALRATRRSSADPSAHRPAPEPSGQRRARPVLGKLDPSGPAVLDLTRLSTGYGSAALDVPDTLSDMSGRSSADSATPNAAEGPSHSHFLKPPGPRPRRSLPNAALGLRRGAQPTLGLPRQTTTLSDRSVSPVVDTDGAELQIPRSPGAAFLQAPHPDIVLGDLPFARLFTFPEPPAMSERTAISRLETSAVSSEEAAPPLGPHRSSVEHATHRSSVEHATHRSSVEHAMPGTPRRTTTLLDRSASAVVDTDGAELQIPRSAPTTFPDPPPDIVLGDLPFESLVTSAEPPAMSEQTAISRLETSQVSSEDSAPPLGSHRSSVEHATYRSSSEHATHRSSSEHATHRSSVSHATH